MKPLGLGVVGTGNIAGGFAHRDDQLGDGLKAWYVQSRGGEGSTHDVDGTRVKQKQVWVDAVCRARIDVIQPSTAKRLFAFEVKGEGTSPRVVEITDEDRGIAFEQAARYAALDASEAITPRQIRESIELDENAPSFDDGFAMVTSERFEDARAIWQAAAVRHRDSAPLYFNLGAVSEAMGDLTAARDYFEKAANLAPKERRYATELRLFHRRNLTANEKAARRRP